MTRMLVIDGAAALAGAGGIALIARPQAARLRLGLSDGEAAVYALRIAGAMILAAALFAGGFTTAWTLMGGAA